MSILSLKKMNVSGKTVLVRTGFDVHLDSGEVADDHRISASIPTLEYLSAHKARTIILSHLGRPTKEERWSREYSLEPVARRLSELWKKKLIIIERGQTKLPDYDVLHLYFFRQNLESDDVASLISQMKPGEAALLENLRFYDGEELSDPSFARKLANLGQIYVNEAFSASHRKHASISILPKLLPAAPGFDLLKETAGLGRILNNPPHPLVVMLGGAKLSDKIATLAHLAESADKILLGGGLANVFLAARGYMIGKSIMEKAALPEAKSILRNFKEKIMLPVDVVVSTSLEERPECVRVEKVRSHHMILDIGPQTIGLYSTALRSGKTLVWNGPMGVYEIRSFSHGSFALARFLATRSRTSVFGVVGGGETLDIVAREGMEKLIDHVSTGGGAMLEFLSGAHLPGLEVLGWYADSRLKVMAR